MPPTLYNYSIHIRDLLGRPRGEPRFDAHTLRAFVLEKSRTCGWAAAKKCTTALRMFVEFMIAEGHCPVGLEGAIPTLAHWRLAALPRIFSRKRSSDSSHRAIWAHPLGNGIGRFCSCWPAWVFGQAISCILA